MFLCCGCWPKRWGLGSLVIGILWHKSLEFNGALLFISRGTERSLMIYNPSLSWSIIRGLSHWLGYPVTLVLLLLCCILLYLHLCRLFCVCVCLSKLLLWRWHEVLLIMTSVLCKPLHWLMVRKMATLMTVSSYEAVISSTTPSCEVFSWPTLNYGPFNNL